MDEVGLETERHVLSSEGLKVRVLLMNRDAHSFNHQPKKIFMLMNLSLKLLVLLSSTSGLSNNAGDTCL